MTEDIKAIRDEVFRLSSKAQTMYNDLPEDDAMRTYYRGKFDAYSQVLYYLSVLFGD